MTPSHPLDDGPCDDATCDAVVGGDADRAGSDDHSRVARDHSRVARDHSRHPRRVDLSRRAVLAGGAAAAAALAGCGGRETPVPAPDPVSLAGSVQCDVCGMVVGEHPGPNGQMFYRDRTPEGHPNPARFDALKACLFPYYFEHQRPDWTPVAVYVTDYSRVDYELTVEAGTTYVSTATAPETLAPAADVTLVVGSDVHGAMGPDFVPFSDDGDARAFLADHGGELVAFDDVTPAMLGR